MPHPREDLLTEIATLRNRVEELEAEVDFMREQAAIPDGEHEAAILLGIPHWLMPVLHLFVMRNVVTTEALTAIAEDMEWTTAHKFSHCAVHRLRQRLKPEGVKIETVWGVGYRTSPDNHAKLKALVH